MKIPSVTGLSESSLSDEKSKKYVSKNFNANNLKRAGTFCNTEISRVSIANKKGILEIKTRAFH